MFTTETPLSCRLAFHLQKSLTVLCMHRGHKSRQKACTELLQQWLREFGGAAASPAATVPVTALSGAS